ncbi:GAI protein [Pelomyxa schiedti]|nr:GAI protein [Pelomyxa schiedti]
MNVSDLTDDSLAKYIHDRLEERITNRAAKAALYSSKRKSANQLELYAYAFQSLPYITAISSLLSEAVTSYIEPGDTHFTLIDIGIGTGAQERAIISHIASLPLGHELSSIHIVGIDLCEGSLRSAGNSCVEAGRIAGVQVTYSSVCGFAETLTTEKWEGILSSANQERSRVVVMASLAMHHLLPEKRSDLLRTLKTVKSMGGVSGVVLAEPHLNHADNKIAARFESSWNHFQLVWELIDSLDYTHKEKFHVKQFFLRELDDVFANSDEIRTERETEMQTWVDLLACCGYSTHPLSRSEAVPCSGGVEIVPHGEWLGIDWKGVTLIGILSFIPQCEESEGPSKNRVPERYCTPSEETYSTQSWSLA